MPLGLLGAGRVSSSYLAQHLATSNLMGKYLTCNDAIDGYLLLSSVRKMEGPKTPTQLRWGLSITAMTMEGSGGIATGFEQTDNRQTLWMDRQTANQWVWRNPRWPCWRHHRMWPCGGSDRGRPWRGLGCSWSSAPRCFFNVKLPAENVAGNHQNMLPSTPSKDQKTIIRIAALVSVSIFRTHLLNYNQRDQTRPTNRLPALVPEGSVSIIIIWNPFRNAVITQINYGVMNVDVNFIENRHLRDNGDEIHYIMAHELDGSCFLLFCKDNTLFLLAWKTTCIHKDIQSSTVDSRSTIYWVELNANIPIRLCFTRACHCFPAPFHTLTTTCNVFTLP